MLSDSTTKSNLDATQRHGWSVLVPGALALALALALAAAAALACIATGQGRTGRALLGQGLREDLLRKVQHFPEILNALVGQGVVVPTPAVDFREVVPRCQRPQHHHHVQVRDVLQLVVLARLVVLLHHHHTLLEEVLQDLAPRLFRNEHHDVATGTLARDGQYP